MDFDINTLPDDADDDPVDGYVILHTPPGETSPAYGIGPFPPLDLLIDAIVANGKCDCARIKVPLSFPKGVVMAVDITELLPEGMLDMLRDKAAAAGNTAILAVLGPKEPLIH